MTSMTQHRTSRGHLATVAATAACLLAAVIGFFLWPLHSAHFLGALPYAFLLLCPAVHLLMHRGHSHQHADGDRGAGDESL